MTPVMNLSATSQTERLRISLEGAVQGVGFRPAVYRLAERLQLSGWVRNTEAGLEIEVEGEPPQLLEFTAQLRLARPAAALVVDEKKVRVAPRGVSGFEILASQEKSPAVQPKLAAILPDLATCAECLAEIDDPANRRHGYAFTNCTQCGPRYTILVDIPYDRPHTTMHWFSLCKMCRQEYSSVNDRRFHAQPNACPDCGPQLWLSPAPAHPAASHVFADVALALTQGKIVALKGVGGFQLLVDARNPVAVARLRERKQREHKPLALLMPSLAEVRRYCEVNAEEVALLSSPAAPIVLLQRRESPPEEVTAELAPEVAPHSSCLGVMLPCSPLHHLLMQHHPFPLVATSGNVAGEPLAIDNEQALAQLKDVADLFVLHDRPIARACDDSVVRLVDGPQILRRARGFAPLPVIVTPRLRPVLAVGGHLKNTVALGFGRQVWLSQHIGDLDSPETRNAFEGTIDDLCRLYRFKPEVIVSDLHPDYASTRWAQRYARINAIPHQRVQHHQAHLASCAAEHNLDRPFLGVAWDGAGLGLDGTTWGGEFFVAERNRFEHIASLRPFALPGGEAAMRDCARPAAGLLWKTHGPNKARRYVQPQLAAMLTYEINSPPTSSVGRLFDAVAWLAGAAEQNRFEGQAAMRLEHAIGRLQTDDSYAIASSKGTGDWTSLIADVQADHAKGVALALISAKFHNALAGWILNVAQSAKMKHVVLSGGVFQNAYLTRRSRRLLEDGGFAVFTHRQVPTNDGGLALGQAVLGGRIHEGD